MVLIKPYLGCNLRCKYCFVEPLRKSTKPKLEYDLEKIFKRMEEYKDSPMSLHGGEPLALPKRDIEKLLKKMFELQGRSAIQTNGTLIDKDYISMFKRYKTSVGISFDGPGILSQFRPGSEKVEKIIKKLRKEDIWVGMIIVIHKANAGTNYRLRKLKNFLLELNKIRINGRLNPCTNAPGYELEEKRLIEVYLDLAEFCVKNNLKWSPFVDIVTRLKYKNAVCLFESCDPYHTPSATVILSNGEVTNCLRAHDRRILLRHPIKYNTRAEILKQIPQQYGGCQGCKYFFGCQGGCPSAAINNDWRNRTYLCNLWKALFEYFENVLKFVEYPFPKVSETKKECYQMPKHLDHYDSSLPQKLHQDGHGDYPRHGDHGDIHNDIHGDRPHGDWSDHGDSM
mgnify:CR=1 FL=1